MFRISIRQWMAVILTVGIGLGWWYDRLRLKAELQESAARVEVFEWQPTEVWTMSGSWNHATVKKAMQEDEVQRKRFAGQLPPKSANLSRSQQSRLRRVTHVSSNPSRDTAAQSGN